MAYYVSSNSAKYVYAPIDEIVTDPHKFKFVAPCQEHFAGICKNGDDCKFLHTGEPLTKQMPSPPQEKKETKTDSTSSPSVPNAPQEGVKCYTNLGYFVSYSEAYEPTSPQSSNPGTYFQNLNNLNRPQVQSQPWTSYQKYNSTLYSPTGTLVYSYPYSYPYSYSYPYPYTYPMYQ